jgi:hypothetical protein
MSRYKFTLIAIGIIAAVAAGSFYWKNLRGVWPLLTPVHERTEETPAPTVPPTPPTATTSPESPEAPQIPTVPKPAINTTGIPLKIPAGFSVSLFAEGLPGARVILFDKLGNAWVSQPSEGIVSLLEMQPCIQRIAETARPRIRPRQPVYALYCGRKQDIAGQRVLGR